MNFIYPRLSKYDYNILRFGGPGLGNILFTYGRALAESKRYNIPMIWPTWYSLKVGPYLRKEQDKRKYNDLFQNNSGCITGLQKIWLRCVKKSINRSSIINVAEVENEIIEYTGMEGMFIPIIDDYKLIYEDLINNLQDQNRGALEFDFSHSISLHIRLGDFQQGNLEQLKSGQQNMSTPIEWYKSMLTQIREYLQDDVKVYIFSDGTDQQLQELLCMRNVERLSFGNSISDLMALSKANLLLASGSTFSMWARYLGRVNVIACTGQLIQSLKRENEDFLEIEVLEKLSGEQLAKIRKYFE